MKIGISRISGSPTQAAELIDAALAVGFTGIQFKTQQLRAWKFDPDTLRSIAPEAEAMARAGVVFHPGGDYSTWAEPVEKLVGWVKAFGAEHVCFCFPPSGDAATVAGQLMATGQRFVEVGAQFSFHNHANTIVGTLDEVRAMCDQLDPTLCGLTFDTAHAAVCGISDLGQAIDQLASHLTNVHLKDTTADGSFCPIGTGQLGLTGVLEKLKAIHYRHWLIVDEESKDYDTPDACAISATFLREQGLM